MYDLFREDSSLVFVYRGIDVKDLLYWKNKLWEEWSLYMSSKQVVYFFFYGFVICF